MIVLGIDPGPKLCGWSYLGFEGDGRPVWVGGGHDAIEDLLDRYLNDLPEECLARSDLIAIECSRALHHGNGANGSVLDTVFAAGRAHGLFEHASSAHVMAVSPQQVRASMIGVGKRGNQDAMIKQTLERLIVGAPKRWNCHMRDAAAAAIVGRNIWQKRGIK